MAQLDRFLRDHSHLTRRHFLRLGVASAALFSGRGSSSRANDLPAELQEWLEKLESYLTAPDKFGDVSRGTPLPHSLSDEKRTEVGLTRETWCLEVIADEEHPARIKKPMTKAEGSALNFNGLMQLAETHAVKFAKVMTCLNMGCPLGMGIWEGVPLREIIWRTQPIENLRRVFYYGYHNDEPKQMFRSSLPIGRVLEDDYDLPPVILCYKLNGQWLPPHRGGPVRVVVPEAYGFKSIKWLSHVVLTNLAYGNDTYIEGNNDIDSPMKSFAATLSVPKEVDAIRPIPVTGYAQVGISGVSKVQIFVCQKGAEPIQDPYFISANWIDAAILAPPAPDSWGGDLANAAILENAHGFDQAGRPKSWPMRLTKLHWAALIPGLPAGEYVLRSRTVDEKGHGQPMPRPFRKSGHAELELVRFVVK